MVEIERTIMVSAYSSTTDSGRVGEVTVI